MTSDQNGFRMLEFFSGIGGMRYALENALKDHQGSNSSRSFSLAFCQAFDISLHANNTYKHNFSNDKSSARTKLVEQLKPKDLDGKADLWTMSPPCQPFTTTRGAKSLDIDDKRCNGLKAIIELLTKVQEKPKFIFLENVKHFADSRMIQEFYKCLDSNGYSYKQYLVSPIQIGVPNHRQRYYILCDRSDRWKGRTEIHHEISSSLEGTTFQQYFVGDYVDPSKSPDEEDLQKIVVPDSILQKDWARQIGVVATRDTATHCFTGMY
jgi:tRNA (cytosine38-C5)-methyltransferase